MAEDNKKSKPSQGQKDSSRAAYRDSKDGRFIEKKDSGRTLGVSPKDPITNPPKKTGK